MSDGIDFQENDGIDFQAGSPPKTVGGAVSNLGSDISGTVKAIPGMVKAVAGYPMDVMESGAVLTHGGKLADTPVAEDWKKVGSGIVNEGKRIGAGELLTGHPINAAEKFGNALYEKPLTTGLDVASLFGLKGPSAGATEVAPAAEAASAAEPLAEAATKTAPIAEEAAKVTPAPAAAAPSPVAPTTPSNLPPEIQDFLNKSSEKIKGAIPDNVKNFIGEKFNKAAETPIRGGTAGKYIQQNARGMVMKTLGASPGQLRKIGETQANKLADYAADKGLVNLKTGDIGVKEKIEKLNSESGQVVGDMRNLAGQRGAAHDMTDLLNRIHGKLGDKFESGMESGGKGSYIKALESVAKTPPTPSKIAQTVTDLFHKAKEENVAAGIHKLGPPKGPYADVARELRAANEDLLKKTLTPKEMNIYHHALEDFGASTQLGQFRNMKWSKDMGGRLPPGMGLGRAALQKILDVGGYRGMAQVQANVAKWLRENPNATTTPKEIFRHYVDESADAMDDLGEGLK